MSNEQLMAMIRQAIVESAEDVKAYVNVKIEEVRTELSAKIEGVRTELSAKIEGVRTELSAKIEEIHPRLDKFEEDMDYIRTSLQEHDSDIFKLKKTVKSITTN
ncbi:hypothetical protein FE782_17045 [Paenibacillus antri]|uniref:Uncharacterized protein n=1 Tax=Paenibacillus antri TaxID=2582848 RepID=A0A5R9GD44_9BACL|nr:hypothetical protein [Paenibacillus antri]TLS51094.1 hypothetical protein FE782_17045 [Paenibacillus antri]